MTSKCSKLCHETTHLRLVVPLEFGTYWSHLYGRKEHRPWKIVVDLLLLYMFTLYVSILGGKMTGYKPQEPSLGIQYSIWPVRIRFLHSYTIHFFTTSILLSQPGVISNSPPKRVVFLMKFKFYRKASKCGLDSPTLLSTVLVNSLTFIIAVLQPNVRTKGQENQPAWGRLAG